MERKPHTVSVVVPVRNGGVAFTRCLDAMAALCPAPHETIVVDDASTDATAETAAAAGCCLVKLPQRNGPAHARNVGAKAASGDIVFFIDADVAVHPDAIGHVQSVFRDDPKLAAVFGSYDDAPAATNFLSQYRNLLHCHVHQHGREEASTFWAGCGAVRRAVFLDAGGFDAMRFRRPSIEDIELGVRLRAAGHRIRLDTRLQGTHLKRWSARSIVRTDLFDRALPWAELILRRGGAVNDLNLRWTNRVSVGLSCGLAAVLLAALVQPAAAWLALPLAGVLLLLNAPLYAFFARKRGVRFAAACIPWHGLHFLVSAIGLAGALCRHVAQRGRRRR